MAFGHILAFWPDKQIIEQAELTQIKNIQTKKYYM